MKKIAILVVSILLTLLIVACSPIQEPTPQVEEKIVTKYQCTDGTFVDDQEDCPKPTVKENDLTSDDVEPTASSQNEDKCPEAIDALRYSEVTDKLVGYLKINTDPHSLSSGDEEGLTYQEDSLFSSGAIYLYFEYQDLPSEDTFTIYKAYSKKKLNSEYTTNPAMNYVQIRPGRAEGIFKAEYFIDKNADGVLDTVQVYSCEGYEVCNWDLDLVDSKTYSKLGSDPKTYNPGMVESYEGEYAGNFVLLSNLFECPFTITIR